MTLHAWPALVLVLALATPVVAGGGDDAREYACIVHVGAHVIAVDLRGSLGPAVGGCRLGTAPEALRVSHVAVDTHACWAAADTTGDGYGDLTLREGTVVPEGATLWGSCDTGTFGETVRVTAKAAVA